MFSLLLSENLKQTLYIFVRYVETEKLQQLLSFDSWRTYYMRMHFHKFLNDVNNIQQII